MTTLAEEIARCLVDGCCSTVVGGTRVRDLTLTDEDKAFLGGRPPQARVEAQRGEIPETGSPYLEDDRRAPVGKRRQRRQQAQE
jgi:hypothetical protein